MGIVTDKLNAEWVEKQQDEAMFAVRAIMEEFFNNLNDAITRGGEHYPTGDAQFDGFVSPIVTDLVTLRNKMQADYEEFLTWRQP